MASSRAYYGRDGQRQHARCRKRDDPDSPGDSDSVTQVTNLLDRITIDSTICHGKPCIRGLRYPVEVILELLSGGMTTDEILADYEDLERDDILAVLAFAARLVQVKRLQPVGG